jgi:hypothetical protein
MSRFDYIMRRKRQSMLNKLTRGGKWSGLNLEILFGFILARADSQANVSPLKIFGELGVSQNKLHVLIGKES